jgi:hypothetical protein
MMYQPLARATALGREPQHDGLEAGHQAGCDAAADEGAADEEHHYAVGHGEQERAGGSHEEQGAVDEARPVAVEEHAAGEHDRGEHQEVCRRKQTEVGGAEPRLRRGGINPSEIWVFVKSCG